MYPSSDQIDVELYVTLPTKGLTTYIFLVIADHAIAVIEGSLLISNTHGDLHSQYWLSRGTSNKNVLPRQG